jgi:hypothetical protein
MLDKFVFSYPVLRVEQLQEFASVPRASELAVYSGASKLTGYMALCAQVVDLIRLNVLNNFDEIAAVGEVSIVENEAWIVCVGILDKDDQCDWY